MATQTERVQILMDPETVALMDKLRGDRSRGALVRDLIREAWEIEKRRRQMLESMK